MSQRSSHSILRGSRLLWLREGGPVSRSCQGPGLQAVVLGPAVVLRVHVGHLALAAPLPFDFTTCFTDAEAKAQGC